MITQRARKRSAIAKVILTKNKNNQSTLDLASMNLIPFTDTDKMTEGIFCSLAVDNCKNGRRKRQGIITFKQRKTKAFTLLYPHFSAGINGRFQPGDCLNRMGPKIL